MKAMIINKYEGAGTKFEFVDIEKPSPKAGEVLVKIAASSVNTVDCMIRTMGKDLPLSPAEPALLGMDFAGTVEAVGDGVSQFKVGDEVYGCAGGLADLPGTLAEYISADAKLVAVKPKTLSMTEAAALPLVGITAYEGLLRCGLIGADGKKAAGSDGATVLVHGGTGGVGHVATQLAKYFGASVYATCGGSDEQVKLIEGYGATAINYKEDSIESYVAKYTDGKGFDVVYDTVGGPNMLKSFEAAALNGQVASTVALCELDLTTMHFKGLSLHVVFMLIPMLHNVKREEHGEILTNMAKICDEGGLKPLMDKTFKLERVQEAHARLDSKEAVGKVVVEN